ncbi:M20 family metallo-hydrolase [Paraburkholderia terricola]|uniref:N-carbamoyl-L-amino-acid hydrolase n=1 Tax=Paraburkholderia terricola TaxID=169427 RepID=A0A1M6T1B4_9BURK|nr:MULTISPECIES: M20 family metallo-hydrolase [Paraburkholderia]SDO71109.1 N-carbamoyl-L-amino-acid hydrolase [Paraburkholderia sediminicola]SHK50716.1 N-carbamoyl-L-amino-acid hydrolase [Paraburkholderia terricola]
MNPRPIDHFVGSPVDRAAAAVSPPRLQRLIASLASFGGDKSGGVNRQALTPDDIRARAYLIGYAQELGCSVLRDDAANLFFRRPGGKDGSPVVTGSHIDTQPTGGRLDGAYGVCAGLETIAALNDAGISTAHPIEVAVWTNEEGCRFAPGSMGSAAFVQADRMQEFAASKDDKGRSFAEELEVVDSTFFDVPKRAMSVPFRAFVEAHIEQGPILELAGAKLGIVTGIQGVRWFRFTVVGRSSHAGTTPFEARLDAVRCAADLVIQAYAQSDGSDPQLRLTVGRFNVDPGAVNTVAAGVEFTIDLRHPNDERLDSLETLFRSWSGSHQGCDVRVERIMSNPPTHFPREMVHVVRTAARTCDSHAIEMLSGAFHDSMYLARHCPTAMLFVPSIGGLSHHPAEDTNPEDLAIGARALTRALLALSEPIS